MQKVIYCRTAPSLGDGFAGSPESVWGTPEYEGDRNEPCVFFGLYGLPDFYTLWRHKGKKYILWAGSDIRHLKNNYWLEDSEEGLKLEREGICAWINRHCESWVENVVEHEALKELGIESQICPSFLGNVDDFTPQKLDVKKRYYSSVSGDDFLLYGWDKVTRYAKENPDIEYHLYGNTVEYPCEPNMILHGRVSQKQMDGECKSMTGALRLVEFEGFSEILAKSILWGQKPISLIDYPFLEAENPREALLKVINKYPWSNI